MKLFLRFSLIFSAFISFYLVSCTTISTNSEILVNSDILPPDGFLPEWEYLAEGLEVLSFTTNYPPFHISGVRVDLSYPERGIVVSSGIRPMEEGSEEKENFISRRIDQFIDNENLLAAINATPFKEYRLFPGLRQTAAGTVFSGGISFSWNSKYDAVVITKERSVYFASPPFPAADTISALAGGFFIILKDGKNIAWESPRNSRSLAGSSNGGHVLILAVIDGIGGGAGSGATFKEAAEWLKALGADNGMLLDGGGSSVLAIRGKDNRIDILNKQGSGPFSFIKRNIPVFLGIK